MNDSRNDDLRLTLAVDTSALQQSFGLVGREGPRESLCRKPRPVPDRKPADDLTTLDGRSSKQTKELRLMDACRLTLVEHCDLLQNDESDVSSLRKRKPVAIAGIQRPQPAGVLQCCLSGENCIVEQVAAVFAQ